MKKQLQKADETSEFIVGEYYLVPHVHVENDTIEKPLSIDVPIIPVFHNDAKNFGVADYDHYHVDGRFVANKSAVAKTWNTKDGYSPNIVTKDFGNVLSEVFYKKKKCLRLETGLAGWPTDKFFEWKKSMIGKSCAGRKCPHYGAVMTVIDGKLKCPMHGLVGDLKKEVIIP